MTYWARLLAALEAWLRDGDVLVNEVTSVDLADTKPDQTVSDHVAELARDRSRFGTFMCALLSFTVQYDHCGATLRGEAIPFVVYLRALLMFVVVLAVIPILLVKASIMIVRRPVQP